MAKVLLLHSSPTENFNRFLPYALLFIRSALQRKGHTVKIIDFQLGRKAYDTFRVELLKGPDILGVSLFCGPAVSQAKRASALCRKLSPGTTIVWGGIMPTIAPEMVLKEPCVDYVLRFEAEESFPQLVDALERGEDPKGTPNLAYRNGNTIEVKPPPSDVLDLSDFPPIDFTDMDDPGYANTGMHFGNRVSTIFTSRGCPHKCTFCYNMLYNFAKWRPFPNEWTFDTIEKLVKTFQIDGLIAFDDNFFADPDRVREILSWVKTKGYGLGWFVELRVDTILNMSIKELKEFYDLGIRETYVGAESGCNRLLRLFNKRIKANDILEANKMLGETKIIPRYSFIIGAPTETPSETLETVDMAVKLMDDNPRTSIWQLNQYSHYPGSPLYTLAIKKGFPPYESLDDWDVGWTLRDKMLPTTTLPDAELATIRYASLFQHPDESIGNRSLLYKLAFKLLRTSFAYRLRKHIFTPFLDTWAVDAMYKGRSMLNQWQMKQVYKKIDEI